MHELLAAVRPRERAARGPAVRVRGDDLDGRRRGRRSRAASAALGGEADLEMLLELRALADAVLIGTGTLRAEGYERLVRSRERRARRIAAGLAEDPVAVLITRRFDIPWEAGLFQAPEQPVLIYTGVAGAPPDVPAPVEVVVLEDPTPAAALADCARAASARCCARAARRCTARWSRRARRRAVPDHRAAAHRRRRRADDRGRRPAPGAGGMDLLWALRSRIGAVPAVRPIGSAPMRIEGASALVAGGASGLGAATARRLRGRGAT